VEAIVMAAGEGRRLRPITERWPKPVLPIDGRPVVVTLLHELADAGVEAATVVTGHLAEQVEALAADCEPRLRVRFARQPEPLGSADAVGKALAAGAQAPLLITAADTVYMPGDVGRFIRSAQSAAGAIAWRAGSGTRSLRLDDGRIVGFAPAGETPHATAALWAASEETLAFLEGLPGPPFELTAAFQQALDAGKTILGVEIGPTRDLTEPADVVRHNFLYLGTRDE
jgi:molybdopterin-guanine dinucleotide biosynthesis protein A